MVRLHVEPAALAAERVTVGEAAHRHLVRVQRLVPGARVVLFDGEGGEAEATIVTLGARSIELQVIARRTATATAALGVTLLQGLARGERFELVVQKATELGVTRIVPVVTTRAVVQLAGERAESRRARWQKIASEAARQSGRATVPEVAAVSSLGEATRAAPAAALKLLLWERETTRLRAVLPPQAPREVWIAIGPEGGFTDEEVATARAAGFVTAGLGPRILRTETAAVAALAVIAFALGELG